MDDNITLSLLQEKIDHLKMQWSSIDKTNEALMAIDYSDENQTNYFRAREQFEKTLAQLKEKLRIIDDIKLPTVVIPNFSGNYNEWTSFRDMFKKSIHDNVNIGNAQKLQHLKSHTRGEASQMIKHLQTTADNYKTAWDILNARYHNERKIVGKYFSTIQGIQKVQGDDSVALRRLHDITKECIYGISNLGFNIDCDFVWNSIILEKLDTASARQFEQMIPDPKRIPSHVEILAFIEERADAIESVPTNKFNKFNEQQNENNRAEEIKLKCFVCKADHGISKCEMFSKMDITARLEKVRNEKVCRMCFKNHHTDKCKSKYNCRKCKGRHSTLIHIERPDVKSNTTNNELSNSFLATVLLKCKNKQGDYIIIRAMIDPGSQATFTTEEVAQKLQVKREKVIVDINGFAEAMAGTSKSMTSIQVQAISDPKFNTVLNALILKKLSNPMPKEEFDVEKWPHLKNIKLADPQYNKPGPIDMVIGVDSYEDFLLAGIIKGEKGTPYAQRTTLGWAIMGKTGDKPTTLVNFMVNIDIGQQLRKFWETENIPGEERTLDDDKCEQFYMDNHSRNTDGRYTVALPFKNVDSELGQSRRAAIAQLLHMEKKFKINEKFKQDYNKCMQEYLNLGNMTLVTSSENDHIIQRGNETFYNCAYLPHHAVFKEHSTTTKLRVVFNASRKTTSGTSLNESMLVGPTIQQDIVSILLRWRKYKFVFSADIEKMYRQIRVRDRDAEFQRIVWRENEKQPIRDYKLTTVTFGTASAPFLAIRTLQQLAKDEMKTHPEASKIALRDFYVDDVLSGCDTLGETINIRQQLKELMKSGGFDLRKLTSNSVEFLESVPEGDREIQPIDFDKHEVLKTLGLRWDNANDVFTYQVKKQNPESVVTKRQFLSATTSIFDPIGYLAPIIVKLKIMYQDMWAEKIDWDEPMTTQLHSQWDTFGKQMQLINTIKIPRWLHTSEKQGNVEFHGFSDASQSAYSAVIYAKIMDEHNNIKIYILAAKTKVAPRENPITLPKLELCGALLLANLFDHVTAAMEFPSIKKYTWCDSMITLAWIAAAPTKWKTFVSNRTKIIRQILPPECWRYVASADNPADCASRGIFPEELLQHTLWWNGPSWLVNNEEDWPHKTVITETNEEQRITKINFNATIEVKFDVFTDFSSYGRLQRIRALCMRFYHNCTQTDKRTGTISMGELRQSHNEIIRTVQQFHFSWTYKAIANNKALTSTNPLYVLNLFTDENGIIRMRGRLANANIPYAQKYAIILPGEAHVTKLLIRDAHEMVLHGGENATMTYLRAKYWILKAGSAVRKQLHKCVRCARINARTMTQIMGELPTPRVTTSRPFTHVGVDYAGPYDVRTSKGRGHKTHKAYISLFVCLSTKVMHLELVSDLTSTGFIAAFKRFIARRGSPSDIYSDNGTNFCAANKFIQTQCKIAQNEINHEIDRFSAKHGIQRHFTGGTTFWWALGSWSQIG